MTERRDSVAAFSWPCHHEDMPDAFTITRTFPAAVECVYAAWTKPEQFSQWFGTDAVDVPIESVHLDARVGGTWSAVMRLPTGDTIDWSGEYIEVEPAVRLVFTMTDDPSQPAGDPVVVEFTEVDGGTRMTLTQPRHDFTDEQVAQTVAGYEGFFDALHAVVAPA